MKFKRISVFLFFIMFLCVTAASAEKFSIEKHLLNNGLTVLISEIPSSSSVSVYGLVKTGSASEGEYLGAGLSHFMEHMLFKGTERRGVGDIPKEIQSLGGTINASTHFDYTIYTLTVPKEHFKLAVDILADMLMHATFDAVELESERNVIFREMKMRADRPAQQLSQRVFETVYKRHPYRIPVIGFEDLLRPLTREDFLKYYRLHYSPNNMVISISGAVDESEALIEVKKLFEEYPRGPYTSRKLPMEGDQVASRYYEEYYAGEILRMSVVYQGVNVLHEDMIALDALSIILGSGANSRLYRSLREEQKMIHSISASNFTPQDRGLFEIETTSSKDNVDEVLNAIDDEIMKLIKHGVLKEELEKVVNGELKSRYMGQLTSYGAAYQAAVDEAVTGKHDFSAWYAREFEKLTADDIVRVAKKYLRNDHRSVVVLKPKTMQNGNVDEAESLSAQSAIEQITLDNGLTVLMREDDTVPLIWINLVVNGGIYSDAKNKDGLSNLLSNVWIKGSKKYSKEEVARLTEQKGISFSSFSGKQSMGIRINALSKDLDFCLKMLSDFIMNPLFENGTLDDQRGLVKAGISTRRDRIDEIGSMELYAAMFKGHPLEKTRLGTEESVDQISRSDVMALYKDKVIPTKSVVSVFGDFNKDEVARKIQQYLRSWKVSGDGSSGGGEDHPVSLITERIERAIFADKDQALVMFGFQAEDFYHKDRQGLELLGAIIGSPFKGRMFSEIRERKGLSYRLGGGFLPFRNTGLMRFKVLTQSQSVDGVKLMFKNIVEDIRQNGVSDEELDHAKAYLIGLHQRSLETNQSLSFLTALDELYGMGYDNYISYEGHVADVTVDDIQRLARRYLDLNRAVVVTVLPEKTIANGQ